MNGEYHRRTVRVRRLARSQPVELALRREIARAYLSGSGLEIGALHMPLDVPSRARVTYVDRLPVGELRRHYPELDHLPVVDPDVIDDAETLASVPDGSQAFVIANHLLEHCEDPIGALAAWARVVKPGGIVYVAVPDKRFTFDRDRPVTRLAHLIDDHENGPASSRRSHYEEWVRLVDQAPEPEVDAAASRLLAMGYSIHFHVWDGPAILELVTFAARELPLEVLRVQANHSEHVVVLARQG